MDNHESQTIAWVIVRCGVVASTMDEVAALAAAGAPEGTVVVADHQTAGRGRGGRAWVSTPGAALQCSVLLRPTVGPDRLSPLSLVVGVAVAGALEAFGLAPRLKWPNDVWLDGVKVAGILVTTRVSPGALAVVAGIGINVRTQPADLPPGATSIEVATGSAPDRDALLAAVLDRLSAGFRAFQGSGGRPDLTGWTTRAALLHERVEVETATATHTGVFTGIEEDGALVLRDDTGGVRRIVAGDLTRGPRRTDRTG